MKQLSKPIALTALVLIAGALIGAAVQQSTSTNFACIDMNKAFNQCKQGKAMKDSIAARKAYIAYIESILQPLQSGAAMTRQEYADFIKLFNSDITPEEKAKAEEVLNVSKARVKRYAELQSKTNPSNEENNEMSLIMDLMGETRKTLRDLVPELENDLQDFSEKSQDDVIKLITTTASKICKERGCSVLFKSEALPYSANDITDAVLAELNK